MRRLAIGTMLVLGLQLAPLSAEEEIKFDLSTSAPQALQSLASAPLEERLGPLLKSLSMEAKQRYRPLDRSSLVRFQPYNTRYAPIKGEGRAFELSLRNETEE